MESFPSLREFLMLRDPYDREPKRSFISHFQLDGFHDPAGYVAYYDIAKASWERYGDEGPPFGTKVITLMPGHGGGTGSIRTLKGVDASDERFFALSFMEKDPHGILPDRERISLAERVCWWAIFEVYDPGKHTWRWDPHRFPKEKA